MTVEKNWTGTITIKLSGEFDYSVEDGDGKRTEEEAKRMVEANMVHEIFDMWLNHEFEVQYIVTKDEDEWEPAVGDRVEVPNDDEDALMFNSMLTGTITSIDSGYLTVELDSGEQSPYSWVVDDGVQLIGGNEE